MNGMIVLPSGFSRRLLLVCLVHAVAVISPTVGQAQDQDLNKTVVVIGTGTIYKNDSASAKETADQLGIAQAEYGTTGYETQAQAYDPQIKIGNQNTRKGQTQSC